MRQRSRVALVRWLGLASLALVAFEACTSSTTTDTGTQGPITFEIASPSAAPAITTLACDDSLVVALTTDAVLRPPSYCGTTANCGSVRVSLLETEDGDPLIAPVRAATANVQLDLSSLVSPPNADAHTLSQAHFIKAEMFGDSLTPYPAPNGGAVFAIESVTLEPSSSACPASSGGAGGDVGTAGASGAGANAGGASGEGGAPGAAGIGSSEGGAAGESPSAAGASG